MPDEQHPPCPSHMEREVFVENAGADEAVAAHIRGCARCREAVAEIRMNRNLLARLRDHVSPEGARNEAASTRSADSDAPMFVEGYDIIEEVQRGGQGAVFRAVHRATNRVVALKVLVGGAFATPKQRRRFEREIEIVAGFSHPNIVTVYDSGITKNGCPYLSMQFVEGAALGEWVDGGRDGESRRPGPSLEDRLRVFATVCDGVHEAHQHGVIHRDLKPGNIMVDEQGEPHILDFGIARPVLDLEAGSAAVTDEGAFIGTVAYASPEQIRRNPALIDVRTDVYSLGVTLYEMLTGALPYDLGGDLTEVLHAITSQQPVPPSARRVEVGGVKARINDELDRIVLKALAKDKDRRYQSAAALRDDVRRYLSGEPVEAKSDSTAYLLRKTLARYRLPAAIGATFLLLLLVSAIAFFVLYQRARTEAEKVKQINIFLEDTLGSVEPARGGDEVTVRELLDEAARWIDIALSDQPEIAASIHAIVGNSYRNLGAFADAERHLQAALRTRLALFGRDHAEVAHSLSVLALLRWDEGQLSEAEDLLRESLRVRRARLGRDSIDVGFTLANLALVRRDRGDFDEAGSLLYESLEIRRRHHGEVHQDIAMCLFSLATVAESANDPDEALRLHQEALDIRRKVLHRRHPDLPRSMFGVGRLLLSAGEQTEAVELLRECLQVRTDAIGDDHTLSIETRALLGSALIEFGRFDEAESTLLAPIQRTAEGDYDPHPRHLPLIGQLIRLCETQQDAAALERWNRHVAALRGDELR